METMTYKEFLEKAYEKAQGIVNSWARDIYEGVPHILYKPLNEKEIKELNNNPLFQKDKYNFGNDNPKMKKGIRESVKNKQVINLVFDSALTGIDNDFFKKKLIENKIYLNPREIYEKKQGDLFNTLSGDIITYDSFRGSRNRKKHVEMFIDHNIGRTSGWKGSYGPVITTFVDYKKLEDEETKKKFSKISKILFLQEILKPSSAHIGRIRKNMNLEYKIKEIFNDHDEKEELKEQYGGITHKVIAF